MSEWTWQENRTRNSYLMQLWTGLFHVNVEFSRLLHPSNVWQLGSRSEKLYPNVSGGTYCRSGHGSFAQPTLGLWTQGHRRMYGKHRGERWWSLVCMVLYIRPWRTSFETRSKQLWNNLLGANSLSILKYLVICVNRIFHSCCYKRQPPGFVQRLTNTAQSFTPSSFEIYFSHLIIPEFLMISSI